MKWYQREIEEIFEQLKTSVKGLTEEEANARLQQYGPNKLTEAGQISRWKLLLHQFTSPLIYILMIAAVVNFFLQEYKDTGVIVAVILFNAVIDYSQELKAEKNVRALKKLVVSKARVIRAGRELETQGGRFSYTVGWSREPKSASNCPGPEARDSVRTGCPAVERERNGGRANPAAMVPGFFKGERISR